MDVYLLEAEVILKCRLGCISLSKNSNYTDQVINLKVIIVIIAVN